MPEEIAALIRLAGDISRLPKFLLTDVLATMNVTGGSQGARLATQSIRRAVSAPREVGALAE